MAILFAGTSMADFRNSDTSIIPVTTAGNIAPYVSEGVRVDPATAGAFSAVSPLWEPASEVWVSLYIRPWDAQSNNGFIELLNANENVVFRLVVNANGTHGWTLQVYNGSGFDSVATGSASLLEDTLYRMDIHIVVDDTVGVFDCYVNGSPYVTFSGNTDRFSEPDIAAVRFTSDATLMEFDFSAVIVADSDTRGLTFVQRKPTGNGAETGWDGDYTDVDEVGVDDGDGLSATGDGDTSTFQSNPLPSELSDFSVEAVVISARARAGTTSNIAGALRIGGTTYGPNRMNPSTEIGPTQAIYHESPATNSPWGFSEVDNAEFGVRLVSAS